MVMRFLSMGVRIARPSRGRFITSTSPSSRYIALPVSIGSDDEALRLARRRPGDVFPFGVARFLVTTEEPPHHRHRLAVDFVKRDDQGVSLAAVFAARQNDSGTYTPKGESPPSRGSGTRNAGSRRGCAADRAGASRSAAVTRSGFGRRLRGPRYRYRRHRRAERSDWRGARWWLASTSGSPEELVSPRFNTSSACSLARAACCMNGRSGAAFSTCAPRSRPPTPTRRPGLRRRDQPR